MQIPIIKDSTTVAQLPVDHLLSVTKELMGAKEIVADVEMPSVMVAPIGAHITHRTEDYTINTIPNVQKLSNYRYKYGITFEGVLYRLYDKQLRHPTTRNRTFQYYGDLTDYAQLIVDNINSIDSGWSVGTCDAVPEKPITFTGATCRMALDIIAGAFEMEWDLDGKEIRFTKQVGSLTTLEFEYGRGKGLYSLAYQYQSDKNIVTRATGYGSSRNLPEGYRDGATQLMFDGEYLDANISLYGIKEGDYENPDIYPEVDGVVSAVSAYDPDSSTFQVSDSGLTFNLNDYPSSDTPKIAFKSGELEGQEFEIVKFDNATKTITAKVFVDGNNNKLPNATFLPAIGDTYTLFDMPLPIEAVQDAEDRLEAATLAWLNENCVPRVLYSLELDPLYARDEGIYLNPGDKIRIIDTALGIDELIRVTKTTYPYLFPDQLLPEMKIVCEIANFIPYTLAERVIAGTIDNKTAIKIVDRTNAEKARMNSLNMRTLASRVFDPDGNLAKGNETLYAAMASFGFDSQNFSLVDVTISANAGADENALLISGGHLIHYFYEVEGLGFDWVMSAGSWTVLDPAKFYYVYAKCSKTSLVGTWEISETPVFANEIPGFWAFNLGQLFEVNTDGYRDFEFTKGMTYIVGDQITTGRIKSMDGMNYLDLTTASANFGDTNTGWDWNVTTPATFTIRGALASKIIEVGSGGLTNAGISGITDSGGASIRFWAGETAANKSTAPFRVQDDGTVIMTKATVSSSETGERIEIDGPTNSLTFYDPSNNVVFQVKDSKVVLNSQGEDSYFSAKSGITGQEVGATIGVNPPTTIWPAFPGSAYSAAVFTNKENRSGDNIAAFFDADNTIGGKYAAFFNKGNVFFKDTPILVWDGSTVRPALDFFEDDFDLTGDKIMRMTWVNGILVSAIEV